MEETEMILSGVATLEDCEAVISRDMGAVLRVGLALKRIREGKWKDGDKTREGLYKKTHDTFEEYLKDRWDISRPRGYQMIEAAEVAENLSTNGRQKTLPTSERQTRPLTKFKTAEEQAASPDV